MAKNDTKSQRSNLVVFSADRRKTTPKKKSKPVSSPISKEVYVLWNLAQDIDSLLEKCVVKDGLAPEEVAAILTHRLGTLISVSPDPKKLQDFCVKLLKKLAQDAHHEAG